MQILERSELLKENGFDEEVMEIARSNAGQNVFSRTGFPKPHHSYRIVYETHHLSIEEVYYWFLEEVRVGQAHPFITKINDIFSASEQSSFFGTAQQRIGLQQEKVSMFLATVGKMVKELFQLVREIRILEERLNYYKDSLSSESNSRISAEITLKGIWVDMVEQGAKNPASVYGMARELQFVTLPDLFYSIHPRTRDEVDRLVDSLDFNNKIKEVLKRKLRQFMEWKHATHKEIKNRYIFTLKYLRQHYDIIKMYVSWVKPYLRNIRRMQLAERSQSPELINAFEGSLVEIEFLAKMLPEHKAWGEEVVRNQKVYSVILARFEYRTKPQMNYSQEYQRGPLHLGQVDLVLRAYAWTQEQIDAYLKVNQDDDFKLLETIDASVKAAMESLGDELERYLLQAGEPAEYIPEFRKKKLADEVKKAVDPFASVFKGVGELFGAFGSGGRKSGIPPVRFAKEVSNAKRASTGALWQLYKNFKKKEKIIAW